MSAARTQTSSSWPHKPLIRIIEGYDAIENRAIRDTLAVASSRPETRPGPSSRGTRLYTRIGGGLMCFGAGDRIDSWEEVAAVPVSLLRELLDAFEGLDKYSPGTGVDGYRIDAVRAVLAHLPACLPYS